ncbi:uncharacterized protein A4U43_C08F11900 [Asparagus officinalis]|nr:uncharacterized protein A4U43_C08F11900 [Asparagus officinalis]
MSLIHDDLPAWTIDDLRADSPPTTSSTASTIAVLAGDALLALSFQTLAVHPRRPPANLVRAVNELARCTGAEGLVAARSSTSVHAASRNPSSIDRLEYIHLHKTQPFSKPRSSSGPSSCGTTTQAFEKLRRYAKCVGLLFQVVDDILDVTKSSQELGKTAGKDLASDKTTYPKLLGLDKSREFAEELLRDAKEQLAEFEEEKAAPLLHLANYIAYRQQ